MAIPRAKKEEERKWGREKRGSSTTSVRVELTYERAPRDFQQRVEYHATEGTPAADRRFVLAVRLSATSWRARRNDMRFAMGQAGLSHETIPTRTWPIKTPLNRPISLTLNRVI
jgi:hypothetical protein